ncbi:VOC family protein [Ancylobacter vacuolatus]|uniref:Enzyme related to lactoylglutathione lyase n=1 Tax=Ancylobacter vacuolatus TaxID=223389 RepID=A0ABU0DF25_9HYPH|nr:VOC family protein [Ancylobacter vacuolatus]MDQ0347028.1 putative enzyme related to lactoylglutathione lyase [Ancylobacter vacuolatus]
MDGTGQTGRPNGIFIWNELNSRDIPAAKAFYAAALGWSFTPMPMQGSTDYWIIRQGEAQIGGIFPLEGPEFDGVPEHWLSYIAVDDVDARCEKALAAGGTVLRAPFNVPDVGRIAIVRDSQGAVAGWMTPMT